MLFQDSTINISEKAVLKNVFTSLNDKKILNIMDVEYLVHTELISVQQRQLNKLHEAIF